MEQSSKNDTYRDLIHSRYTRFRNFSSFQTFAAEHGVLCCVIPEGPFNGPYWRGHIKWEAGGHVQTDDTGTSNFVTETESAVIEYVIDLLIDKNVKL